MSNMQDTFSFVVPNFLAGCAVPGKESADQLVKDIDFLKEKKIAGILSVNDTPPNSNVVQNAGLEHLVLRLEDRGGPNNDEFLTATRFALSASGGKPLPREENYGIVVHCDGGKGRTGTILAGYMVAMFGLSAADALARAREMRPGSAKTEKQAACVAAWENYLDENSSIKDELYVGEITLFD